MATHPGAPAALREAIPLAVGKRDGRLEAPRALHAIGGHRHGAERRTRARVGFRARSTSRSRSSSTGP
jgi:hypothetical protein